MARINESLVGFNLRPLNNQQVHKIECVADLAEEPEWKRLENPLEPLGSDSEDETSEGADRLESPEPFLCLIELDGIIEDAIVSTNFASSWLDSRAVESEQDDECQVDRNLPVPGQLAHLLERHELALGQLQVLNVREDHTISE